MTLSPDGWAIHGPLAEETAYLRSDAVAQIAVEVAIATDLSESWLDKPITGQDVSDAVTRFAPALPPSEFAAFVSWNCEHWEGVPWSDALPWNLQTEWLAFLAARRAAADGVTTTRP